MVNRAISSQHDPNFASNWWKQVQKQGTILTKPVYVKQLKTRIKELENDTLAGQKITQLEKSLQEQEIKNEKLTQKNHQLIQETNSKFLKLEQERKDQEHKITDLEQQLSQRNEVITQGKKQIQERENYWQNKQKEWKQKKIAIKKELAQQVQDYQELTHEKAITDQTLTDIHQSFHQGQEIVKEMEELVVDLLEINKSGVANSKVKQLQDIFRKLKGKMKWGVE